MPEGLWDQVVAAMEHLEEVTGRRFGDPDVPLLVAVRSGAKFSMPGMMDTVLDIGLSDDVVEGMVKATGDERFVLDSYRRLIQMFGSVVLGVGDEPFEAVLAARRQARHVDSDAELTVADLRAVVASFRQIVDRQGIAPFPADPLEQLRLAIEAVFESWRGQARPRLPGRRRHPPRPRHGGQRRHHGVWHERHDGAPEDGCRERLLAAVPVRPHSRGRR
jgi:pyruvate,orthophosphate dikinase